MTFQAGGLDYVYFKTCSSEKLVEMYIYQSLQEISKAFNALQQAHSESNKLNAIGIPGSKYALIELLTGISKKLWANGMYVFHIQEADEILEKISIV